MTAIEYTLRNQLRNFNSRLQVLERTPRLAYASISEGGLTIRNGGGLTIEDGGKLIAYHPNGVEAFYVGPLSDNNYAFIVQSPEESGMIRYYRNGDTDQVYLGYEGDRPDIAMWGRVINITSNPETLDFNTNDIGLWNQTKNRFYGHIYLDSWTTLFVGGSSPDGGSIQSSVVFPGNDRRRVHIMSGAGTSYVPIYASEFTVPSSVEIKEPVGDLEDGALDTVRATPIRKWKYSQPPQDALPPAEGGTRLDPVPTDEEAPEQIGPYAEEVHTLMGTPDADDPADRAVDIGASLWMLWKAVQELSDKVDRLEAAANPEERK